MSFSTAARGSFQSQHLLSSENSSSTSTSHYTFHAWFCMAVFIVDIVFIIGAPRIPIFPTLHTWKRWFQWLQFKLFRTRQNSDDDTGVNDSDNNENSNENNNSTPSSSSLLFNHLVQFYHIDLDMSWASVIAIVVLLASGTLDWNNMKIGLLGAEGQHLQPYSILLLFMSLSYVCVSLDVTGLFSYIANWIIKKSNYNGHKLFIWFSLFASVLTIFTSNDIVILTLTPICCYMCLSSRNLDPVPYVISQFFLANVWSVLLEIGNPTNVIVALAYELNFLVYSKWMALPAISSGTVCFILLYIFFYSSIPKKIELVHDAQQNEEIRVPHQSREELEEASAQQEGPPSSAIVDSLNNDPASNHLSNALLEDSPNTAGNTMEEASSHLSKSSTSSLDVKSAVVKSVALLLCLVTLSVTSLIKFGDTGETIPPWIVTCSFFGFSLIYDFVMDSLQLFRIYYRKTMKKPFDSLIWKVLVRLPWKIIPFILSMFTIVQLLNYYGWTDLLAKKAAEIIITLSGNQSPEALAEGKTSVQAILAATMVMSYLSSLACNVINNQPMTILFTSVISSKEYKILTPVQRKGSMFSLILGSNFGANITLFGALAGIMFLSILRQNGITNKQVNYFTFLKYGLIITPIVILVGSFFIFIELLIFE
ncbi:hypothetical protein C9374_000989 [Naegleria lovaniensis]|uniref:Citrate transporter-like domain-containing protein n=1 Tax=Naegleria lovaniensis TaxID=51637 RepID=A0AA88GXY1_NAELO|nr:uncharacterized protein C9374_000989 [Naegleria lovaniensis]KAG2388139.1 hypothetical protein C9374_000989 [Naegleria lovaniensis]